MASLRNLEARATVELLRNFLVLVLVLLLPLLLLLFGEFFSKGQFSQKDLAGDRLGNKRVYRFEGMEKYFKSWIRRIKTMYRSIVLIFDFSLFVRQLMNFAPNLTFVKQQNLRPFSAPWLLILPNPKTSDTFHRNRLPLPKLGHYANFLIFVSRTELKILFFVSLISLINKMNESFSYPSRSIEQIFPGLVIRKILLKSVPNSVSR